MKIGPARRNQIVEVLLAIVGFAGVLSVAMVVPNALQALDAFGLVKGPRSRKRHYVVGVYQKLKMRGLVQEIKSQHKFQSVCLTKKGKLFLLRHQLDGSGESGRKRWDGKWRVVVFDIEERQRRVRDELRDVLRDFGFVYFQKSIWVYPYPCEEKITLLREALYLGNNITYMTTERFYGDTVLQKRFRLL